MSELYFSFAISLQKFLLTFDFEFLDPDPHQGHFSHSGSISKINSFYFWQTRILLLFKFYFKIATIF